VTPARLAAVSPLVCGLPIWAAHLAGAPNPLAAAAGIAALAALTTAGATTIRPKETT
jgi:hypothetical protein